MNELTRWDPFKSAVPFGDTVFDMVPAFFRPAARQNGWVGARMDVAETENAYELAIELPGIPKEAIQVSVYENTLSIAGESKEPTPGQERKQEERNWLLRERNVGKFTRTITLPEAVDDNASQARYADGVLYLTLQKRRASQVKRLAVH
ncbi:MAG TPA: Hsp20/alpha crystallin family protein [Burkholderiales bacterium]|nr:Hsp20/alpha crystallin family protein [Burkholderiales bacterium]